MIGQLQGQPISSALPNPATLLQSLKRHKWLASITSLLLIAAIVAGTLAATRTNASAAYVTTPVLQQDLTQAVTASGTVNPQNTVSVSTQVSGTVSQIFVDYNSKVKKGQVLAKLDPSQLEAQLSQARAALAQTQAQAAQQSQTASGAQANITEAQQTSAAQAANAQASQAAVATAQSNVAKAQAAQQLAQQTLSRDQSLLSQGYIAQSQYDSDRSNAVAAQTGVQSAQAALAQARAQATASVNQAQASSTQTQVTASQAGASQDAAAAAQAAVQAAQAQVQQDELNLQRTIITSPVDGTVIARDVSVGSTVAASFQSPTLFSIAQDLKKMEVDINVGEPDIGNVRPGDTVTFSVLAYPNQTFQGSVTQVRVNPSTVNNVVTYTVITDVNNPQGQLLPGMTANATINVKTAHNALVVPTQALTFRPSAGTFKGRHHGTQTTQGSSPWGQTSTDASAGVVAGKNGVVFVQRDGKIQPVRVRIDLVSGTQAAVTPISGELSAGDNAIVSSGTQTGSTQSSARSGRSGSGSPNMGGIGRALR